MSPPPHLLSPSTVHPSGQTGFYAARLKGGTLTGCDVLVPDEILNKSNL